MVGKGMSLFKKVILKILSKIYLPIRIQISRPAKVRKALPEGSRYLYQKKFINFNIPKNAKVLDIGSGPVPFPGATVLCERYLNNTVHRYGKVITNDIPIVQADISALPFPDKKFDFVYSAHVLEHVDDPIQACREIMRVGKRGYLETPNFMKDTLFCYAELMHHRWHTIASGNTIFFFEYNSRQLKGIRSSAWNDMIWSKYHNRLQDALLDNMDLFNTMFLWEDKFEVQVVTQDGKICRS